VSDDRTELRVTLAVGVSRCGKTILLLRYLAARRDLACRFIFDPLGQIAATANRNAEGRGLAGRFTVCETEDELEVALAEDGWVFFDPSELFPGDQAAGFDWFCRWSYDKARQMSGRKALLADEVWMFQSKQKFPQSLACWIQDGAKWNCEVLLATHDPHKLNSSLEGQITELVCFYLQGDKQLEYVARLGIDPDEVASLPNGSFIARDPRTRGEFRGKVF